MSAGKYNFTIEQGADLSRVFTWKDANGSPVSLVGYTARMKIKDSSTGTTILSLTNAADANGNVLTLGGLVGTITLTIKSVTTTAMTFTEGKYDLELVDASNKVTRLVQGIVSLSQEVTT